MSTKKREYKALSTTQGRKVIALTKKGVSQKDAARKIGVAKLRVSQFLLSKKVGRRRESEFWSDVRTHARTREVTWKEAREVTFTQPFWARKRAKRQGKEYKSYSEFWKEWREKWRDATEAEKDAHGYDATFGTDGEFVGGTPR